jgi:hypothetical protein
MNGRKNGTKNERSYGRCGGILCDKVRFRAIDSRNGPTKNVATLNFGAGGSFDPTGVWVSEDSIG